jgi:hypothetical protein
MALMTPSWRRLRPLLGGLFLFVFVLSVLRPISAAAAGKGKYLVYIGTYTDHGSKGIYAYHFDAGTGQSTALGLAAESAQPSFVTVDAGGHFLYAVNETESYAGHPTGAVSAFAIDSASGKLSLLNQVSSRDGGPAHITLDQTGKYALVANYTRGSVAVFPVLNDGRLGEPPPSCGTTVRVWTRSGKGRLTPMRLLYRPIIVSHWSQTSGSTRCSLILLTQAKERSDKTLAS